MVKMNDAELVRIAAWEGIDPAGGAMRELAAKHRIKTLCVTRGAAGAALYHDGVLHEHPGYSVEVMDTVGSGDAFLAGLLDRALAGAEPSTWLEWANLCDAFVASRAGATPRLDRSAIELFARTGKCRLRTSC